MSYYLDAAATTPLRPSVKQAIIDALDIYGNPSSQHHDGQTARQLLDTARQQVADLIGATADEIFFTSGATESNNIVLNDYNHIGAVVISSVEHPSVHNTAFANFDTPTLVPVSVTGSVLFDAVDFASDAPCAVMLANNETGLVHDISYLRNHQGPVHVDLTQYVPHFRIDVHSSDWEFIDTASFSAHKFGGPKGVGILYVNRAFMHDELTLLPQTFGGGQESGLRPGTENVLGIIATGVAATDLLGEYDEWSTEKRDAMVEILTASVPKDCTLNFMPSIPVFSLRVPAVSNSTLAMICSSNGLYLSTGSACHGDSVEPSRVLLNMGLDADTALETIRISPPHDMSLEAFTDACHVLSESIAIARSI